MRSLDPSLIGTAAETLTELLFQFREGTREHIVETLVLHLGTPAVASSHNTKSRHCLYRGAARAGIHLFIQRSNLYQVICTQPHLQISVNTFVACTPSNNIVKMKQIVVFTASWHHFAILRRETQKSHWNEQGTSSEVTIQRLHKFISFKRTLSSVTHSCSRMASSHTQLTRSMMVENVRLNFSLFRLNNFYQTLAQQAIRQIWLVAVPTTTL